MKRLKKRTINIFKTVEAYRCSCTTCPSCSDYTDCIGCTNTISTGSQYRGQYEARRASINAPQDVRNVNGAK